MNDPPNRHKRRETAIAVRCVLKILNMKNDVPTWQPTLPSIRQKPLYVSSALIRRASGGIVFTEINLP